MVDIRGYHRGGSSGLGCLFVSGCLIAARRRGCRIHGGAHGSGGPKGARNGNYKHGRYTADTLATRRSLAEGADFAR